MSKPYGLTLDLRVVVPDRVQNIIYDAVQEAIDSGISPKQFKAEVAECWEMVLKDNMKHTMDELHGN